MVVRPKDRNVSKYIPKYHKFGAAITPERKVLLPQRRYDTGQLCAE